MDSCNSGSFQSSSGGDDEYDSRAAADSVSAFFTGSPIPNPPPPQPQPQPQFLDPLSNYGIHLQFQNPNTALPRTADPRSDPNSAIFRDAVNPNILPSFIPSFQAPPPPFSADHAGSALPRPPQSQNPTRNPKKRARASRRAPTTVLTTDTSNFRAMVQEFTGIPSPTFNSTFPRTRLDLFGARFTSLNGAGVQPPPYLRRPFAQKIQSPLPFLGSSLYGSTSASVDASIPASSSFPVNNIINSVSCSTDSGGFPPPMTCPNFNLDKNALFSSLLRTNPKFPFSNSPLIATKSLNLSSELMPSSDDQFDLPHGNQVSDLPSLLPSDQTDSNNAARWRDNPTTQNEDKSNLGSENGGFDFTMNVKPNDFSSGSSTSNFAFTGEKEPNNSTEAAAGTRGEGMMESWICSSE